METTKKNPKKHPISGLGIEVPKKKSNSPSPNSEKTFF